MSQLKLIDFSYHLPETSIAQKPAIPRDSSKLLLLDKMTGELSHHNFFELDQLLDSNTVLVRNNTKVIPARIYGKKETGGLIELLLVKRQELSEKGELWEIMTKPGLKVGQVVTFQDSKLQAICQKITGYTRLVEFNLKKEKLFAELEKIGNTPIPPYIKWDEADEASLRTLYQTIYAKYAGSAAAPTAGLHFTERLEERLIAKGIEIEEVTLHVGLGTFLPVKDEDITSHQMHAEVYELTNQVADSLNRAKKQGKKILAVGTTTTRVLEACANDQGILQPGKGETKIYIYPPYKFKFVDQIITNFHLPKSTLLMMISAFVSAPNTKNKFENFLKSSVGQAYLVAIKNDYRFYSFGDGMLIK